MSAPGFRNSLLNLLADGRFHSGAALAETLGRSRTAVWNAIHELQEIGLELNAVSGKGYRLTRPLEFLSKEVIIAEISEPAKALLTGMEIHDEMDSTNTYLMSRATAGAPGGTVCLAEFQTAGRGRV